MQGSTRGCGVKNCLIEVWSFGCNQKTWILVTMAGYSGSDISPLYLTILPDLVLLRQAIMDIQHGVSDYHFGIVELSSAPSITITISCLVPHLLCMTHQQLPLVLFSSVYDQIFLAVGKRGVFHGRNKDEIQVTPGLPPLQPHRLNRSTFW